MQVAVTPQFRRQFRKLPRALQEEALEKIELFGEAGDHPTLRIHRLHGELRGRWSFSVNYRYRILFVWERRYESAILIAIGDYSLYK